LELAGRLRPPVELSRLRTIILALVIAALLAGCGGSSRTLGDGQWYGKLVSVDVSGRRVEFAPACFSTRRRWVARRGEGQFTIGLAEHPSLAIYYRPNGEASAGHGQGADLGQLARIAAGGRLPDFPPGWFITVRGGGVASVVEDSGLRSGDPADKRTNVCIWSRQTRAFVK
jgi:hypothetical protein